MPSRNVLWNLTLELLGSDESTILVATGRVSHATSRAFSDALERHLPTARPLIVDIAGVDYISSAGFHVLEQAAHRFEARGVPLVLCGMQDAVRPAFELAGPVPSLAVVANRAGAIAHSRLPTGERERSETERPEPVACQEKA